MKTFTVDRERLQNVINACQYGDRFAKLLVPEAFDAHEISDMVEDIGQLDKEAAASVANSKYYKVGTDQFNTPKLGFTNGVYVTRRNNGPYAGCGLYLSNADVYLWEIVKENSATSTLVVSKKFK